MRRQLSNASNLSFHMRDAAPYSEDNWSNDAAPLHVAFYGSFGPEVRYTSPGPRD